MQNKTRLLQVIGELGQVDNPKDLVVPVNNGLGIHSIVHLLWSCQKLGLLTFVQVKQHNRTYPSKIRLTPKGREYVDRNA